MVMKACDCLRSFVLTVWWWSLRAQTGTAQGHPSQEQRQKNHDKCGIFFAESTIPGAGMGMYAGHSSFEVGDMVTDSDIMIPVIEMDWHNDHRDYHFLWNEYVWGASLVDGLEQEAEDLDSMHVCSPGMGAAVNCRLNLVNVEDAEGKITMGMSGVSSESPGAGAFTPYFGRQFEASTHIPAGMELFLSYGEAYFASRTAYRSVPLKDSYERADKLLKKIRYLKHTLPAFKKPGSNLSDAFYHFIVDELPFKSRVIHALPPDLTNLDEIFTTGGTANLTYNESIRDLEWLEEHGQCMDNIKDGISTLPDAGRGAFANRFIPKGSLVSPMPLIHVGDRDIFTTYETNPIDEHGYITRNSLRPNHHQLLLNYCFGHNDTQLLLCPYGLLTSLINHSHKRPNAKIQWSKHLRHPEWFNESYVFWHKTKHSGLSFDVIALRDIEQDEEIFIDYGEEWEAAWQSHVSSFDRPRRDYMPAFEMNNRVDLQLKTIDEVDYEGIDGVFTFCRQHYIDRVLGEEDALWDDEDFEVEANDLSGEECYPCRITHRNHNDSYIAELFTRTTQDHPSGLWDYDVDTVQYVLFDLPRDAFYFHDAYYKRDHSQEWAFRHDLRIPDDIFPDAWRSSLFDAQYSHLNLSIDSKWIYEDDVDEVEKNPNGDKDTELKNLETKAVHESQESNHTHGSSKKRRQGKSEASVQQSEL